MRAGQVLAELDVPDLQEELRQARANAAQAAASYRLAAVELARYKVLYRDSVITREELDQRQANYDATGANVAAANANVRRTAELVGYASVTAPFAGVVTARNVDQGVLVSNAGASTSANPAALGGNTLVSSTSGQATAAGGTSALTGGGAGSSGGGAGGGGGATAGLFRIAQADTVRLYVGVPQSYAGDVHTGLRATVHVPDMPQRTFAGKVVRTAGALDAATRTLLTEVDLPNLDGRLLPGMYTMVSFKLTRSNAPVMIPAGALLVRQQGAQAVVVGPDSVLQIRALTVGRDHGSELEVLTGLTPGETVVVNPTDDIRSGQRVRPRAQAQGGAPSGNSPGGRPANPPPNKPSGDEQGGQKAQGGQGTSGQGQQGGQGGSQSGSSQSGQGGRGGNNQATGQQPPVVRIGPPGKPSGSGRP